MKEGEFLKRRIGVNEMLNGAVQRKLKKEQFFVSNTGAGIMTWAMVHLFQSNFVQKGNIC